MPFKAFKAPGDYIIILFPNDDYIPRAQIFATVKPWDECLDLSACTTLWSEYLLCQSLTITYIVDCESDCQHGICPSADSSYCDCDPGFEWNDCSRGCGGEALELTEATGSFSQSGQIVDRSYSFSLVPCSWHIVNSPGSIGITLDFAYFESSSYEQLGTKVAFFCRSLMDAYSDHFFF